MTLLLFALRMAEDLFFYYAFAAFFLSFAGPIRILPAVLMLSICYALSSLASKRQLLRMAWLLPCLALLLLPGAGLQDYIAQIPAIAYAAFLIWSQNYTVSHARQMDVFLLFCRVYPVFFLIFSVMGSFARLLAYSLPYFLSSLILCVFLLRVLRHDPEVRRNPHFLFISLLQLLACLAAAWLLHLDAVLRVLIFMVRAIYTHVIAPILMGLVYLVALPISLFAEPLLSLIAGNNTEIELNTDFSVQELLGESTAESTGISSPLFAALQIVFAVLVILLVAFLLLCLFRRLADNHASEKEPPSYSSQIQRKQGEAPEHPQKKASVQTHLSISRVRRQYRRYLQLCREKGFTAPPFYTSLDIEQETAPYLKDPKLSLELRNLYIRARYQKEATSEDATKARELVDEIKKQMSG